MGRIRIDGGFLKGRYIRFPDVRNLRPLTSHIKKALFDIIGDIHGLFVLDAFCGTGIFGIESISRGAESVIFVERSKILCAAIRENMRELGIENRGTVICGSVERFFRENKRVFHIVFLDPPFSYTLERDFLSSLRGAYEILILRRHRTSILSERPTLFSVLGTGEERFYSDSVVYFFHRSFGSH